MEIRLQGTAIPCVAQQDIMAGRAVKLVPAVGKSNPDVVIGAAYPSADEDPEAKYVAQFRVYNEKPPIYEDLPTLDTSGNTTGVPYILREWGTAGASNLPADVKLRMVVPRLQIEQTIPSGALMLAYDEGIYTVTTNCFVDHAFVVGDKVSVNGSGANAGKWQEFSAAGRVGTVLEYDSTLKNLTIKTEGT
jgi:hypothetical protein